MRQKPIYRRKPKNQRTPPVWRDTIEITALEEAIIETHLYFRSNDMGYTAQTTTSKWRKVYRQSASIHTKAVGGVVQSVTLITQDHVVRWNHKAQNHFLVDETRTVRTVYRTSTGKLAFYFYNVNYDSYGKRSKTVISPYDTSDYYLDIFYDFKKKGQDCVGLWREIATRELGQPVSVESVYPGIIHFGSAGFGRLGPKVMRANTAREATELLFGKRNARKDLVRAVGRKMQDVSLMHRSSIVAWVQLFKNVVPVDWLVEALNKPHYDMSVDIEAAVSRIRDKEFRRNFLDMVGHLKMNERRNILLNTHGTHHGYYLADTVMSYMQLQRAYNASIPDNRRNVQSVHHLHQILIAEQTRIARERRTQQQIEMYKPEKMAINSNEYAEQFAFMLELDNRLDIRFARDYETLSGWSDYMVNCISSYFSQYCLLGGIYEDGKLVANFELPLNRENKDRYALNQLLGRHNQKLDANRKETIESILAEYGIELLSNRWA